LCGLFFYGKYRELTNTNLSTIMDKYDPIGNSHVAAQPSTSRTRHQAK